MDPDPGSSATTILLLATLSRLATVLLAALSRWLAPPYDASPALPPGEALAAPLAAQAQSTKAATCGLCVPFKRR